MKWAKEARLTQASLKLRPARTVRAIEDIAEQIRVELREGRLSPGQRLPPERELAQQLGVSRNTVREAMTMLEMAGLVQRKVGAAGGAFITESNAEVVANGIADGMMIGQFSLADLADARLALETFIARKGCEVGTEAEFQALEDNLERTAKIPDQKWERKLDSYREFLTLFIGIAHNPLLIELAKPLIERMAAIVTKAGPSGDDKIITIRRRLVAKLKARDPEGASKAVAEGIRHIHSGWILRAGDTEA